LLPFLVFSQKQVGMEQYYYWQTKTTSTVVPKVYYQSPKNWHSEFRYNYENDQTASLHFGKKFSIPSAINLELIPLVGLAFGNLNGASAGTMVELSFDNIYFSSEPQYVHSFRHTDQSYFYSWSELVYEFSPVVYGGLAVQQTKSYREANFFEPGVVAAATIKNFEIPFYCFSPFKTNKNFVIGVNWQWKK
jgi:hypothetical protein